MDQTEPEDVLVCPDCAKDRGYRHPHPENLERFQTDCAYCGKNTLLVRLEDLFPPNEPVPYEH